jgi:hypothetical protein
MSLDRKLCSGKGCNMKDICLRYDKSTFRDYSQKGKNYVEWHREPPFKVDENGVFKCFFYIGPECVSLRDIFTGNIPKRRKKSK